MSGLKKRSEKFIESTCGLLNHIEAANNDELDPEELLDRLTPSFFDWSHAWIQLQNDWFETMRKEIPGLLVDQSDKENLPVNQNEVKKFRECNTASELIKKYPGLLTKIWYWYNNKSHQVDEGEDEYFLVLVLTAEPNNRILVPMKHWRDNRSQGGNQKSVEDNKKLALEAIEDYSYQQVKKIATILQQIVEPSKKDREIEDSLNLHLNHMKARSKEQDKLKAKLEQSSYKYFQDPDVYWRHIKKLSTHKVVCFRGIGQLGKSALAVEITRDLIETEGEDERRRMTKGKNAGMPLPFPQFGTNYILQTTKTREQGDFAQWSTSEHKAGEIINPQIHQVARYTDARGSFNFLLRSILKSSGWTQDQIRDSKLKEKEEHALEIIKNNPHFLLLDNYEDIERNPEEKSLYESFLRKYNETPEIQPKESYIILTSRQPLDDSIAFEIPVNYLKQVPSTEYLRHLLERLVQQDFYVYRPWMTDLQAQLTAAYMKLYEKLLRPEDDRESRGGFPPVIGLVAHTFLSQTEKPEDASSWVTNISTEVEEKFGDDLSKYCYDKSTTDLKQQYPYCWNILNEFTESDVRFTLTEFLTELDQKLAPTHAKDGALQFLKACEARDLVVSSINEESGETYWEGSLKVTLEGSRPRSLELSKIEDKQRAIESLKESLQETKEKGSTESFKTCLSRLQRFALGTEFSVDDYHDISSVVEALERLNITNRWGREDALEKEKNRFRGSGIRRLSTISNLSLIRSDRFVEDMIEMATNDRSGQNDFSKLIQNLAIIVVEEDHQVILDDDLVADGLLRVLVASSVDEGVRDKLTLDKNCSKAWLRILKKITEIPGIEQNEIQKFIDFCLGIIQHQKTLREEARNQLLVLRSMLDGPYLNEDIFEAFREDQPVLWGENSQVGDSDYETCRVVLLPDTLIWKKEEGSDRTYVLDTEDEGDSNIELDSESPPQGKNLLAQVVNQEPGKLEIKFLKYTTNPTDARAEDIGDDRKTNPKKLINELITEYPIYKTLKEVEHGLREGLEIPQSKSIRHYLREHGLGKDIYNFIDKNCKGVNYVKGKVCRNTGSNKEVQDHQFEIENIAHVDVPSDPGVTAAIIKALYNVIIEDGEDGFYKRGKKTVEVLKFRRAIKQAVDAYNDTGDEYSSINEFFMRLRFALVHHKKILFAESGDDYYIGPNVLLGGYMLFLKEGEHKDSTESKEMIAYLTKVMKIIHSSPTEHLRILTDTPKVKEMDDPREEVPEIFEPEIWNWVIDELVKNAGELRFKDWKSDCTTGLLRINEQLNGTQRSKVFSIAHTCIGAKNSDTIPHKSRGSWKEDLMTALIESTAMVLHYDPEPSKMPERKSMIMSLFEKVN